MPELDEQDLPFYLDKPVTMMTLISTYSAAYRGSPGGEQRQSSNFRAVHQWNHSAPRDGYGWAQDRITEVDLVSTLNGKPRAAAPEHPNLALGEGFASKIRIATNLL